MLQTSVGAVGVTSRPYSASPTVRAAGNTNRPYREHCKGGWLSGWLPTHYKNGSNVNRPYSVGRDALLVSFSRSDNASCMHAYDDSFFPGWGKENWRIRKARRQGKENFNSLALCAKLPIIA